MTNRLLICLAMSAMCLALTACGDDEETVTPAADTGASDTSAADSGMADAGMDAGGMDDAAPADTTEDDTSDAGEPGGPAPTLTMLHDEVFVPTCGEASCHTMGGAAAGINLDNDGELHDRLLGSSSIRGLPHITPNDPSASYLYLKCSGEHLDVAGGQGSRMPLARAPLTDEQLQMIADWINDGAPNN